MEVKDDCVGVKFSEYQKVKSEDGEEIKILEQLKVNDEDSDKKQLKTHKRRLNSMMKEEDSNHSEEKLYRRIILSLTKPSYLLKLGLGSPKLRWENRKRLRYLLHKLVRQRNWVDASGVLSVLLKGTSKEKSLVANRLKYTVSMELLNHVESGNINPIRIRNVYDIWMKRIGSVKDSPLQDKFVVQLEFIIFCLAQGDVEEAHQGAISLMQEREFMNHPMSNMVMALTFYERWRSSIPREMQWNYSDQIYSPMQSDCSQERFSQHGGNSGCHDTVYSQETETHFRRDSNTSIMIGKQVYMQIDSDLHREGPREDHVNIQRENAPIYIQPLNVCMNSAENEASFSNDDGPVNFASVCSALEGLDPWILPIQLPKSNEDFENFMKKYEKLLNDDYKKAVKYLRLALYSTPPVSSALLPFIQLLLIGGHVDEALIELDKFCNNAQSEIPVRLRASLLECFDRNNYGMLSTCYEDILKKDPTCCRSLARLISMHQNGDYSTESLLEMIALHLDATYADYNTWREFALCFLKLACCEEDRMSVCLDGNEGDKKQRFSVSFNRIPNILAEGKSAKNWMLRCRWWLKRHFTKSTLASDIAAGDLQLLTYKAACASHMYGQEFEYVVKAYSNLQTQNDTDLFMFLQMHRQNSIGLYLNYVNRNKR